VYLQRFRISRIRGYGVGTVQFFNRTTAGRRPEHGPVAAAALALALLAGCATSTHTTTSASSGGALRIVAAENFWGSIATQLGGDKVGVESIITNPDTDPHDYDPSAADARDIANANVVIENGIGYDPWVSKLLAADHVSDQHVIDVGSLVKVADGGNPHRWYNPTDVHTVIAAITTAYVAADPGDAAYFATQQKNYETTGLAQYNSLIGQIKATYAGTPVGASESIFAMMAPALGLNLLTPPTFLRAISEGTDPTSADKTTIDNQIKTHAIKVYVYNSQNATPDVQAQVDEAKAAGIPVTTITETLSPATATFQDWQVAQLTALQTALKTAKGQGP
jgi:zinc/manganese transport system substrate-binding protein